MRSILGSITHSPIEWEIICRLTALLTRLAHRPAVRDDADPGLLARWVFHLSTPPAISTTTHSPASWPIR